MLLAASLGLFTFNRLKKKREAEKAKLEAKKAEEKKEEEKKSNVTLRPQLVTQITADFLNTLEKALPENFVAIPLVAVERIFSIDSGIKDAIRDQYFDVVVFAKKNYKPLFVIDLYNPETKDGSFRPMDNNVVTILKSFDMKILRYPIGTEYSAMEIKLRLLQLFGVEDLQHIVK